MRKSQGTKDNIRVYMYERSTQILVLLITTKRMLVLTWQELLRVSREADWPRSDFVVGLKLRMVLFSFSLLLLPFTFSGVSYLTRDLILKAMTWLDPCLNPCYNSLGFYSTLLYTCWKKPAEWRKDVPGDLLVWAWGVSEQAEPHWCWRTPTVGAGWGLISCWQPCEAWQVNSAGWALTVLLPRSQKMRKERKKSASMDGSWFTSQLGFSVVTCTAILHPSDQITLESWSSPYLLCIRNLQKTLSVRVTTSMKNSQNT